MSYYGKIAIAKLNKKEEKENEITQEQRYKAILVSVEAREIADFLEKLRKDTKHNNSDKKSMFFNFMKTLEVGKRTNRGIWEQISNQYIGKDITPDVTSIAKWFLRWI